MTQVALPSSDQQIVDPTLKGTTSWFTFFHDLWLAVRGGTGIAIGGNISTNSAPVSNSGAGETDLMTFTVNPNLMANNGDEIYIKAWGTFAANANNKTLKLIFGSQTLLTTGGIAANDGSWQIEGTILRKAVSSEEIIATILSSNGSVTDSVTRTAGTQNLSNSNIIKITGQGSASNDITQFGIVIKFTPNI